MNVYPAHRRTPAELCIAQMPVAFDLAWYASPARQTDTDRKITVSTVGGFIRSL